MTKLGLYFGDLLSRFSGSSRHGNRVHSPVRLVGGEALETRRLLAFDPSPMEQAYLEDINRMRVNPQGELDVIFSSTDPLIARETSIQTALTFFDVDRDVLLEQWSQLTPVSPVAWNEDLIDAAEKHSILMRTEDVQSHRITSVNEPDLAARIAAEGYPLTLATENVYAFAQSHLHGHAGFVIDWGDTPTGIQSPPGHRNNYMNSLVQEVGISVVTDNDPLTGVGPNLVTEDFARRDGYQPQILGVVYEDGNDNGIYDPGEGYADQDITVVSRDTGQTYTTKTLTAGGYQLEVPNGFYEVRLDGFPIGPTRAVGNIEMESANVKVDFEVGSASQAPIAIADSLTVVAGQSESFSVTTNDVSFSGSIVSNSVVIVSQPTQGQVSVDDSGQVTYTANSSFSGTDTFTYTARDTNGATSNVATVNLSLANGNSSRGPVAENVFASVSEEGTVRVSLVGQVSDANDAIDWNTLTIESFPPNGTAFVDSSAQSIVYVPNGNFNGSDSLTFSVANDAGRRGNVATLSLTVVPVNDLPVAADDTFVNVGFTQLSLQVLTNDTDIDSQLAAGNVEVLTQPSSGSVSLVNGDLVFIPGMSLASGPIPVDTFTYRINDGNGGFSDPVTVTLYNVLDDQAWQNPENNVDVTGDGVVSPLDALQVINNIGTPLVLPATSPNLMGGPPPFVDVNGDGFVSPIDALLVINALEEANQEPQASLASPATLEDEDDSQNNEQVIDRVFASFA